MIKGVIPVLQTPFCSDDSIDLESLRREVQFVCATGVTAVTFPGFASEWWKLSEQEIFRCAEVIVDACPEGVLLIANVTAQSTHSAIQHARCFLELGAGALMCLPPFLFPVNEKASLLHLRAILEVAPVPVVLQYAEGLTNARFEPECLLALHRDHPNLCCIKLDFSPAAPTISELARVFAERPVTFLVGYAGLDLPDSLARGAHGMMPGSGHLREDMLVLSELQEMPDRGLITFDRLYPLLKFEMQSLEFSIAIHKKLLHRDGVLAADHLRKPGLQLSDMEEVQLLRHVERFRQEPT